jgi:hypothetical protein
VKCTKTEKFIGKGASSLVALFQALSETAGSLPVVLSNFTQMGLSESQLKGRERPK